MKRALVTVLGAAAITACSIGETNYEKITLPVREAKETRTCDSKFVVADLAKLKPCGTDGKSHCYPWSKTSFAKDDLDACSDTELCMPDKYLTAGGNKAHECKFGGSDPGACVPLALKQVRENAAMMQRDSCDEDEKCAPCIHPVDKTNTGACDPVGVHEEDCVGGPGDEGNVETCCHGSGVCLDQAAVPDDSREDMSREVCSEGRLCAPAAMADGKPTKCDVLGVEGVCLDVCFAAMLKGAQKTMRGGCGPTELCLPCVIGKGQGMPGCD